MKTTPLNITPQLKNYIQTALLVERDEQECYQFTMIPRQFPCLMITTEKTEALNYPSSGSSLQLAPCNIYFGGIGDAIFNFTLPAKMELILVHFYQHCTGLFWGDDAVHYADARLSITQSTCSLKTLNEKIHNTVALVNKWKLLQQFLLKKTVEKHPHNLRYAANAVQLIQESCGLYNIKALAAESCTCERNLQQSFKQHVGISPKQLSAIVRFNALVKDLTNADDSESLMEKADRYCYYDLSHVYKDFHRYLGKIPSHFDQKERLTNDLV